MRSGKRSIRVLAICALAFCTTIASAQLREPNAAPVDQIIVKYKRQPLAAERAGRMSAASSVAARFGALASHKRSSSLGFEVLKLDRPLPARDAEQLAAELMASDASVVYAEPDRMMMPLFSPNDPYYPQQWSYFEAAGGINAPLAWDLASGSGLRVAVLDTGSRPHPDLAANFIGGYDFISSNQWSADGDGRDSDHTDPGDWVAAGVCSLYPTGNSNTWHGLHVSGTVAALTNNSTGVAGVAFNSKVVPVRVLGQCGGHVSDIADAIVWASGGSVSGVPANPYPAKVLNLSLGARDAGPCGGTYQNAINSAISRGSIVVVAAGNENAQQDHSPGNCSYVVTVASTDRAGGKAGYSNYGSRVEISAPGGGAWDILSTANNGAFGVGDDTYLFKHGTSMAAPHISGIIALMWSRAPSVTATQVRNTLFATARQFPVACPGCGIGIADAGAAVTAMGLPSTHVTDVGYLGCNGSYQIWWNAVAGATSYKIWRKTPTASEISYYSSSTTNSAAVFVGPGSGKTNFHVQACLAAGCGVVGDPASLPYYLGCP